MSSLLDCPGRLNLYASRQPRIIPVPCTSNGKCRAAHFVAGRYCAMWFRFGVWEKRCSVWVRGVPACVVQDGSRSRNLISPEVRRAVLSPLMATPTRGPHGHCCRVAQRGHAAGVITAFLRVLHAIEDGGHFYLFSFLVALIWVVWLVKVWLSRRYVPSTETYQTTLKCCDPGGGRAHRTVP